MLKRLRSTKQLIAAAQALALLALGSAAQAGSVGTPPGGNREPISFLAGSPFSRSTWTPAHNAHIPGIANGLGLAKHGFNLILDSTSANITLGRGLIHGHNSVDILLGSTETSFSANDKVTAAEFIAILQVLANRGHGTQTLVLDSTGIATGGVFSLNHLISPRITALEIPQNVVALDNIKLNPLMGMMGPLTNNGTIYAYSTSNRIHTGLIYSSDRANNGGGFITNTDTGMISTASIPSSVLPAGTTPLSSINLVLAADHDIINHGTIVGSGDLKFATAYGSIQNTPTNITGSPTPIIQAFGNVYLLPGAEINNSPLTAMVVNTGTIMAATGNIKIDSPVKNADIVLIGTDGTNNGVMQAFQGAINVREAAYKGSGNTLINGGSYIGAAGFNIFSGTGNIIANNTTNASTSAFQSPLFSFATTGTVDVQDSTSNGVTVGASTGGSVNIATGGDTTLTSLTATNGAIYVAAAGGTLQTVPGAVIAADNGSLTLQNLDGSAGNVVIGFGSQLSANGGNVILAVDSNNIITPTNATTSITNVNISGTGTVFAGANGINALPPTNTATTAGANIIFDAATNANQIELQGLVNINASATPVAYSQSAPRADEMIVDSGLDAE